MGCLLGRRVRPGQARGLALTAAFAGLVALAWTFGLLLHDVLTGTGTALVDRPVLDWLVAHRAPWLTSVMAVVTDLGATWVLVPLVVAAGLGMRLRGRGWQPLGLMAAAFAGAWTLSTFVKAAVGRPRPPLSVMAVQASGMAFPSGHATQSTAVYGMLAVLAASALARWRAKVAVTAGLLLVVLAVGFSRAYLGVHWVTDVLAGWSLGGVWLLVILAGTRLRLSGVAAPDRPAPPSDVRPRAGTAEDAPSRIAAAAGQAAGRPAMDRA